MSVRRAAIVLWCALMIVLPAPAWHAGQLGLVPPWRVAMQAWSTFPAWHWSIQALLSALLCLGLAAGYYRVAMHLPLRIRGALVGLLGLSALIVFSALPVYYWPADAVRQTFIEIYRLAPP